MNEPSTTASPGKHWGLKAKLILSMLFVGVVPLVVGLGMAFWQGSQEIRDVSGESFKALATEAARKLDLLVAEEVARTSRIANDAAVIRELERRRDLLLGSDKPSAASLAEMERRWRAKDPALVKRITDSPLSALLREYYTGTNSEPDQLLPPVVRTATKLLFLTDTQGVLVAAMTTKPDFLNGDTRWWQGAYNKAVGQLYIEDVHFDARADTHVFTISLPVMDSLRYEVVGVLHRVIDAKEFFSPSTHVIRFGKTGHVMLIDSHGVVMSCPILPTGVALSDMSLVPLITPMQPGWVQASSDGHGGRSTSVIGFAPLPETSRATNGSIDSGSWHTFVWQSSDELFAPIQHLFTWMTVFGTVAIALLASLGYVAASRIVTPVRQLQQAARSIGRGELRSRIRIQTGDELEDLAEEFNRMNQQLEAAFAGLTSQVQLKTEEVQYLQQSTDQILDTVPTPIMLVDARETVQYVNRAARESFRLDQSRSAAVPLFALLPVDESTQSRLRQEFRQTEEAAADGPARNPVPRDPLAPAPDQKSVPRRSELQIGARLYHYQWFRLPGRPGEEDRIGLVLRDTTDESRLQDQLIQAEKTGSLGVLTAGIGHELNNPLFGIVGLGEAIQEEQDVQRIKTYARDIVAQGRRMAAIIRDFTGVATREGSDQRVPVQLEAELDQALATVRTTADMADIAVEKQYAGGSRVLAMPDQLRQALANLLTNAVQAMKGAGRLTLTTRQSADVAVLSIADSGPGIAKQHLSKIFDPFFTTKGQGEGSGLGLTVARRILRKFGGDVRIESLEGQGTTCVVTLPILPPSPEENPWTATASRPEPLPSHSS
ncbi:PAS domain-containing sensor histidine kinase [Nitrospira moscoviensis]|uniref:histidine kinase n=1 Tax=Nitrospira moscoviensis TaxID=42253 RepID=A0A0K2GHQ3_NITMO|nr:PAS domain-containing sensor histidine kinase [Nitrospira moscoviensis]ALA60475.1 putative Histidine kinase [Nitrospira moscoviensis]